MTTKGRPKGRTSDYVEMGLRGTRDECELIQRGAELEAARLNLVASRNNFCLRAALSAARREIERHEQGQQSRAVA